MNKYEQQAQKMKSHLQQHPKDYQTVISLFKVESDSIFYEQQKSKHLMLREIAKYQRKEDEYGK
ncbi:hypothetical protein UAW_01887 [Enterococcus haemoperoxidus ATCC BAA-382]|uniref:Uncharacterized protein n=1 Tax=Enterococcus haemoperoxidus ATCC BAA-382 TaxID=1158608 RepID=R2QJD9_9ENTE|nr:hypothetical protein [Enterococcus haemoperoxidus]EOH96722.1 hypothetical protein UAW_01887 [Enterococcus haemoperoxidus ATCC BAA-382]EOT60218.1 hypothetical protein I583_02853 [Enterococcus haemoperoxidus ATCC BAA-382]OJG52648.1 hypothetical protein RV06_GL000956 [Enterococcus haemoperoxidus]